MKTLLNRSGVKAVLHRFHRGEQGMETLQVVVIVAIAALVVLLLNQFIGKPTDGASDSIAGFVQNQLSQLFQSSYTTK